MRDRLMKLLCGVECEGEETFGNCPQRRDGQCRTVQKLEMCQIGAIADHLLANGVIVPPCKVGDTVYVVNETVGKVFRNTVIGITIGESKNTNTIKVEYRNIYGETSCRKFRWAQFGKQVFFTRKEAERALKGDTTND